MKTKDYVEKMGKNGEITIPRDYWGNLGLCPGEEVTIKLADRYVLVEPVKEAAARKKKTVKDPVKALTGSIPLPMEIIDELVENEDLYNPRGRLSVP